LTEGDDREALLLELRRQSLRAPAVEGDLAEDIHDAAFDATCGTSSGDIPEQAELDYVEDAAWGTDFVMLDDEAAD